MCRVHNLAVSLLLYPLIFYVLVARVTIVAFYILCRLDRVVTRIILRKKPLIRDKFDIITFAKW